MWVKMTVKNDPLFENEYNCLVSDLVDGFPPNGKEEEGSKMYVWDDSSRTLVSIFKKVFDVWYKL
jgi:hypothetical protein